MSTLTCSCHGQKHPTIAFPKALLTLPFLPARCKLSSNPVNSQNLPFPRAMCRDSLEPRRWAGSIPPHSPGLCKADTAQVFGLGNTS